MQWIEKHGRWLLPLCLLLLCVLACALRALPALPGGFGQPPVDDAPMEIPVGSEAQATIAEYEPGAYTVIAGGFVLCTLADAEQAEALIAWLLAPERQALPEGYSLVRTRFTGEVLIRAAVAGEEAISLENAKAFVADKPFLCPVECVARSVVREELPYETTETEDARLAKGSRLYLQAGRAGEQLTITQHVFLNGGEQLDLQDTIQARHAAIDARVAVGTYTTRKPESEPGRHEGETGKAAPKGFQLGKPCAGSISSYFGIRNNKMHNGLDYPLALGGEVLAMEAGVVSYIGERGNYGILIEIDHGDGFITRMAPLQEVAVTVGGSVAKGQVIATLGAQADEEGEDHLHVELLIDKIPYNPRPYM